VVSHDVELTLYDALVEGFVAVLQFPLLVLMHPAPEMVFSQHTLGWLIAAEIKGITGSPNFFIIFEKRF
jgi:hypothetical protein